MVVRYFDPVKSTEQASTYMTQPTASASFNRPATWPELLVLLCSGPCMAIMFVAIAPVLPGLATHFASMDSAFLAQMVMTLPGVGIIAGGPAAGWLAERVGAVRVVIASLALYATAGAGGLFLDVAPTLLLSRFLLGVAAGGIASTTTALISERFDDVRRARMLGYQTSAASATAVLAILGSGAVAELGGWRAPFSLYPILGLPLLFLAASRLGGSSPPVGRQTANSPESIPKQVYLQLAAIVLLFAAAFMTGAQTAFLLAEDGVRSPWLMSMIIGAASLGNAVGSAAFGHSMTRFGPRLCIVLSLGLMAAGLAVLGLGGTPVLAGVGCLLAGLGSGLMGPWVANKLLDSTPSELRSRVSGLLYAAIFIGDFLNPLLVLPMRRGVGLHGAFLVVASALAATAVALVLRRRRHVESPVR